MALMNKILIAGALLAVVVIASPVLAQGFQTYGEDFDVEKPRMDFTIKLKRPKGQFSIYEDHPKDPNAPKSDAPPPDKKPN